MERWQNRIAVVTGASSGIGAAIAKDLAKADVKVVGLARRVERVEDLKNDLPINKRQNLTAMKCDVSDPNSVDQTFDKIISQFGGVDILVNNAGTIKFGQMLTVDLKDMQRVMQTNVMGLIHCTQRAFKSMKERNFNGHVVLINSIVGHQVINTGVVPDGNIYPPSKFAVTAITEILRREFSGLGTKIKVTSVSPGVVDTEIIPENMKSFIGECCLQSEDVSSAVLYAIATPPHVQIHELTIKPVGEMF